MFFIPQIGEFDCGYACLKMMLAHIHKDKNYLFLPFHEKNQTISYQQMSEIALKYNVEVVGFRVEDEEEIKNNKIFPLIVSLKQESESKHAVMITGIKWNRVQISDPAKGTYSLSFKKIFNYVGQNGIINQKLRRNSCPFVHQSIIKKREYVMPFTCQVMTGISGVLSVYFFDKDISLFIPLFVACCFWFF